MSKTHSELLMSSLVSQAFEDAKGPSLRYP